jgi:hypothetical protein
VKDPIMFELTAPPDVSGAVARAESEPASPRAPELFLGADACLWLRSGSTTHAVRPVRCFPWSRPDELISLRSEDGTEHYLVANLRELDPGSREALARALAPVGFVLEISAVESIEEDYEVRVWRTRTRHGRRTFQTALDAWPWPAPAGGYFVQDIGGDLFRLPPLAELDAASQARLFAYVG